MGLTKAFLLVSLLCVVAGDDKILPGPVIKSSTSSPIPNPTEPTPSPSPPTPTTSSTAKPTPPPTQPTPAPTQPTPAPTNKTTTTTTTTTTPKTTTTASTTTTSTPKTTTSTAAPTTSTTAKPTTPAPVNPVGKWSVNTTDNKVCLVLEAALEVDVEYKEGNATKTVTLKVPSTATATGVCGSPIENITLTFNKTNWISFNFVKSNDSKKYDLHSVTLNVTVLVQNVSQVLAFKHNHSEFSTPVNNSYKCSKELKLNLTEGVPAKNYDGQLRISHLQVQAFRNANTTKFDEALDCMGSETPDVVPIAVGCALAALVIIVLVAYLIGRRRSQARGYLSM